MKACVTGKLETDISDLDADGDGVVDVADDCTTVDSYWADYDGDGYYSAYDASSESFEELCESDIDNQTYLSSETWFSDEEIDVDDSDANLNIPYDWYADNDGDGYGDADIAVSDYTQPDGYVANSDDTDDTDANVYPGAPEICDGKDNDGNGLTDEADSNVTGTTTYNADTDNDGYGSSTNTTAACALPTGYVENADDCDDTDADVNPDGEEVCNGKDDDCDLLTDSADDDADPSSYAVWYRDADGDGFADVNALESTDDTLVLEECDSPGTGWIPESEIEDVNGDGLIDENDFDADDSDTTVKPNNVWYADSDSDGYGDADVSTIGNYAPTGYVADNTDFNDSSAAAYPGATEVCDDIDNDGNGLTDDDDSGLDTRTQATYYSDFDDDTYGDADEAGTAACDVDAAESLGLVNPVENGDDCDDLDDAVHPGATPQADFVDTDCDGAIDEFTTTADADATLAKPTGAVITGYAGAIGDLDDDGVLDIAVTDPRKNSDGSESGSAFVVYGSVTSGTLSEYGTGTSSARNGTEIEGGTGGRLGRAIVTGDWDGDGVADLLTGSYFGSAGSYTKAGEAYLMFGPIADTGSYSLADALADHSGCTYSGIATSGSVGAQLNTVGDLNGDGIEDIALGTNSGAATETAYIFYGGACTDTTVASADVTILPENSNDNATSAAAMGDIDGDGLNDLGVPANLHDDGALSDVGAAYLISGSSTNDLATADVKWIGAAASDKLGNIVSQNSGCDVDGDGYADWTLAAPGNDDGGTDAGSTYIGYGSTSGFASGTASTLADMTIQGQSGEALGDVPSFCAKDPRGEGVDGLVVSASSVPVAYLIYDFSTGTYLTADVTSDQIEGSGVTTPKAVDGANMLFGSTLGGSVYWFGAE